MKYILLMLLIPSLVFADSERRTPPEHDVITTLTGGSVTNTLVGGDTTIGDTLIGGDSSKALGLGFSYSLGDVDLNEGRNCYVSTAKGNIIFGRQKVELNPWCAALFYDANRKHKFAAKLRCAIDDIIKQYDTRDECVSDQTFSTIGLTNADVIGGIVAKFQEFEDEREVLVAEIQQQLEEQEQQYDELAARRSRPRAAPPPEPQPYLSQELADQLRVKK